MAASFASRLSGLREKKSSTAEQEDGQLRLTLPPDLADKSSYEPSSSASNTRTSFRMLKGRIQKGQSSEKPEMASSNRINESNGFRTSAKLTLLEEPASNLKLTLFEDPATDDKKPITEPPKIPLQKRILIAKEAPKEESKREEPPAREQPKREDPPLPPRMEKQPSRQLINAQEKPIHEEEAEESMPAENENDLVMCSEGCGRKFNRKALEKHAKACKLVFMSKRKEFNSEAKRVSKEQTVMTKQSKIDEKKKMGVTRGKGFDKGKTGQNWKAASEGFRSAIKAMKKDEGEGEGEEQGEGVAEQEAEEDAIDTKKVIMVQCQYCEKQFNEIFIDNHLQNCVRRKEKERDRSKKKPVKR